jgi:hypothetical protein
VHRGRHHSEPTPEKHHGGEPDARLDIVEREIGRDLTQDIAANGNFVNNWSCTQRVVFFPVAFFFK